MPVSDISSVPAIMNEVVRLQPKTVMDLGIGFGKYGVLCREVLDAVHGRVAPCSWRTQIYGVEGFASYQNPVWQVYDDVTIQDMRITYQLVKGWDLVLMIDSLEHLSEAEGAVVLDFLVDNNKNVIVSVPLGWCPQGAEFGNEFERHRTTFIGVQPFYRYRYHVLHSGVCLVVSIQGKLQ